MREYRSWLPALWCRPVWPLGLLYSGLTDVVPMHIKRWRINNVSEWGSCAESRLNSSPACTVPMWSIKIRFGFSLFKGNLKKNTWFLLTRFLVIKKCMTLLNMGPYQWVISIIEWLSEERPHITVCDSYRCTEYTLVWIHCLVLYCGWFLCFLGPDYLAAYNLRLLQLRDKCLGWNRVINPSTSWG